VPVDVGWRISRGEIKGGSRVRRAAAGRKVFPERHLPIVAIVVLGQKKSEKILEEYVAVRIDMPAHCRIESTH